MEETKEEDIVIIGAGISGLATSLGLYRLGIRSLVLEGSDRLRTTGFAISTWTNAWRALEALGVAESLRQKHDQLSGFSTFSMISGIYTSEASFKGIGKRGETEVRCIVRKVLLEELLKDLPCGTIRFSSKVVSIEESGFFKLIHLSDGNVIRTKLLIGCDGVNSLVAKWLGFKKTRLTGRLSVRGCFFSSEAHGFEPKFLQLFGDGVRCGVVPCDRNSIYWFFTWRPSSKEEERLGENPAEMKRFVLSKLENMPEKERAVIENTSLDCIFESQLGYRNPFELLYGNISKGNVCVAGDALHPMTPDVGQGGCSALEDAVILARCLAEVLRQKSNGDDDEFERIETGLRNYARERKWRSFRLISVAYVVGYMQQCRGSVMTFLRDKCFAPILTGLLLNNTDFDCGKLSSETSLM